jgi:ABC-type nitrate/sulfonate/bicarbonate transport system substrate-binding protein
MPHLTGRRPFSFVRAPLILLSFVAATLLTLACGNDKGGASDTAGQAAPKEVTFMAAFKPQANLPFVGAYVAQEKGFFSREGIKVDIKHNISNQSLQLLEAGVVQFTTADASDVLKRIADPGLDLESVALVGQKGQQGFAVLANSGINTPADWAGKTLGYKGSPPPEFFALARTANLNPDRVNLVRVGFDPRILSERQVDILAVFMSNEPDVLDQVGIKTKVFDPNDYGVPLLGLTYVTTHEYATKDPEAVARFVRASLQGIDYAILHRDEAVDIVMKYAPEEDRVHQRFMLDNEIDRALTDETRTQGLGWQTEKQWQELASVLSQYNAIAKPVDVKKAFTNEFVEKAHAKGKLTGR